MRDCYYSFPITLQFTIPSYLRPYVVRIRQNAVEVENALQCSVKEGTLSQSEAFLQSEHVTVLLLLELYKLLDLTPFDDSLGGFAGIHPGLLSYVFYYEDNIEQAQVQVAPFSTLEMSCMMN